MANVQKYTKGHVQGLSIHWDRKTENHANKDIDVERSHLNYDLCEKEGDSISRLNKRLAEVHCLNRKDVNHCACWVVTLPEELKEKTDAEQRAFFEKTYEFLTDRYGGEKNVISANVHNDETTPHMHFAFVPTMFDTKRNMDKVCAKKVVSRKDLQSFHTDLDKFLKEQIPHIYEKGILNDKTIGIEDIKELKEFSDEIKQQRTKLEREKEEINQERQELKEAKERMDKNYERVKRLDAKIKSCFDVESEVNFITERSKSGFGKTVINTKNFDDFKNYVLGVAKSAVNDTSKLNSSLREIGDLKNDLSRQKYQIESAQRQNKELRDENKRLQDKNSRLSQDNNKIWEWTVIYRSWLKDMGKDNFRITNEEYDARLILDKIEQEKQPETAKTCREWQEKLDKVKDKGLIPENRLKNAFERLKTWLSDLLNKERRQEQKRSKSRDMGC